MTRKWSRAEENQITSLLNLHAISLHKLNQIHSHIISHSQSQNNFIAAKLVRSFAHLGALQHARSIAHSLIFPNIFVWTSLIRAYSLHPFHTNEAFFLYAQIRHFYPPLKPLCFTLSSVLKACAQARDLVEGEQIHSHVFKHGFHSHSSVQTTLIDLYAKCGCLSDARKVFDEMRVGGKLDVQARNAMVSAWAEAGDMEAARNLFDEMAEKRNTHTYVAMINGYAAVDRMDLVGDLLGRNFGVDGEKSVVFTAVITGYAKSGDLSSARRTFDELDDRDAASWNAMITAYTRAGFTEQAADLFRLMLGDAGRQNIQPNHTTISTICSAFARSGSPGQASFLQSYVDGRGAELLNSHTVAALIDLHSKCGRLDKAYALFRGWRRKDLVCCSAMIAGFGIHGCGEEAVKLFEEIRGGDSKPDSICFVSILAACSHSGMVREGREYFELMRCEYGITPMAEHCICVVDLLGRAGKIEEAYRLINEEGCRFSAGVWGALLSACRIHCNVEIGEIAARWVMEIEPENDGNYVLLSNMYARAGRWDEVARVRAMMKRRGVRKEAGGSLVEMEGGGRRRKFMIGEALEMELEEVLLVLSWELKDYGYLLDLEEIEEWV